MITVDTEVAPPPATAVPAALRPGRFTLDGDDALERHLAQTCVRVLSGIRGLIPAAKIEAVLLGGGYGRGEGGVLRGTAGDRPYNDLEFYVALKGNRHVNEFRFRRRLEVLGEILTHLADAEVEFKIASLPELRTQPVSMFSYDLVAGHRVLWCDALADGLPGCDHHGFAAGVAEPEGTRLLMNRCSGLLFARVELDRGPDALTPAKADFIRRNIAKVQLACGDVLLTSFGRYHWSCRERHHRLEQLADSQPWPWLDAVLRHHRIGVEFKLHPVSSVAAHAVLVELHREVTALALQCWLAVESRRLGRAFPSAAAYAADPVNKCPGSAPGRNFLLNLRVQRFRFRSHPNPWRHPRQRIFHALALRLWEPGTLTEPALHHQFKTELAMEDRPLADWLPAYRALWSRVQ